MRKAAALALLLAPAACAPRRPEARVLAGADLAAYRRLAVLPYGDRAGEGRAYAPAAAKALYAMGYDVAPLEAVESLLRDLDVRRGEPVGLPTLHELRRRTQAQAVVLGTVACARDPKARRVTVLFVDSARGDAVFELAYSPERCGTDAGAEEAAVRLAARVRREVGDRLTGRTEGALP
ncbi:hypothetical protein EPO15_09485 [bacterium]|nr:MAG: hypothetical protein EPO15_09485 [bacterium]